MMRISISVLPTVLFFLHEQENYTWNYWPGSKSKLGNRSSTSKMPINELSEVQIIFFQALA